MDAYEIVIYGTESGKEPFTKWIQSIKDSKTQRVVLLRIQRLRQGNFGDCKSIHKGVCELRIDHGPGYRIYFANIDNNVILLLGGGDKGSQNKDLENAKKYLADHKERLS